MLTEYTDDCEETIQQICDDAWSLYMVNVIILTPTADYETILMYTFYPYTAEQCEGVKPIVYDTFENGSFISPDKPIFPNKFENFFRCPLKIATYQFPPLMMLTERSNDTYIDGIEGVIIRVMSQRLNFTTIVVPSSFNVLNKISSTTNTTQIKHEYKQSLELVRKVVQSKSYNLVRFVNSNDIIQISDGTANVTLGAIIMAATRAEKYEMTQAYFYGSLLYAIPNGKPYGSFEKLFFPFRYKIWILLATVFAIAAMILLLLKLTAQKKRDFLVGASNNMPFFNMVNICLGGTMTFIEMPLRTFARAMLMMWLLSSLVVSTQIPFYTLDIAFL